MFGNFDIVGLGSYDGILCNLEMKLCDSIGYSDNFVMELCNLDNTVVDLNSLVG